MHAHLRRRPLLAAVLAFTLGCVAVTDAAAPTSRPRPGASPKADTARLVRQLLDRGVREVVFALRPVGHDPHWYANISYFAQDEKCPAYATGGKLCRLDLATGTVTTLIDDRTGCVRDPVLHYDGRTIVFSYRKSGSGNYHLYRMDRDGTGLRQLTSGPYDDIEPAFLPDGRIVFVSTRCNRWVQCWLTKVATLYRCDADGGNIRNISGNLEHDNTPWPLPDGRILYQRWEYIDRSQVDYHHLWTANPDGTGAMVYFGNMHPGTVMIDAKPVPGTGKVVAIFSPGHGHKDHDGFVTVVDTTRGPDDPASARNITREPRYRDPWAFDENLFLAARGRSVVLIDGAGRTHEIYHVSAAEAAAGLECHEPRPVMPRARERVVPDRSDPTKDSGTLLLMDVYHGRKMEGVRRGEIKKLLVLESLPKPINYTGGMDPLTYGGSFTLERVLGTVPVEADGSAHFQVPALRSLFFVALDGNDLAVKRMHSFTALQPGEVNSCAGCHERRTEAIQLKTQPSAVRRPPSRIEPIADCPDVFDFPRDIQPVLDKLCGDCHSYDKTSRGGPIAGGVILSGDRGPMYSHAYFTMTVRRLFTDNRNRPVSNLPPRAVGSAASRILTMLDGSHHGVKADDHQRRLLRLWTEVGAPYPGTYAALGCGSIGGYAVNEQTHTDTAWPTTRAGTAVLARRCGGCHVGDQALPRSLSDERHVSFWRFQLDDPRLNLSRHILFNLTRPEKSLIALAPLAASAGGLGMCRDKRGQPASVFASTDDADYQALVAMARAGKDNLDRRKRFDMPGFRPTPQYLREMRHYGVLAADHADDAPVDPYALDRRYWQSLWFRPVAKRP